MKHYIKILLVFVIFIGISKKGLAQCFPNLPVTGTFADPATSSSPNAERVFWLTWGANTQESRTTHPYGKAGTALTVGSKSYGSIDLGGGRFMCIEAEIIALNVSGTEYKRIESYIPGTFQGGTNNGDFLDILYNRGGSGGLNNYPFNQMASGIINKWPDKNKTVDIVIKIKATTGGEPVRLRGMVLADAESLASNEYIYATGDGNWSVAEVKKNIGQGSYNISKQTNTYSSPPRPSTETILFEGGNDKKTGAIAFLTYKNTAYASKEEGYAVTFSSKFYGHGKTAIAIGLLTSNYDFGDAPSSYGKPIHLIDDISLGSDGIVAQGSTVDVNGTAYDPGLLKYETRRYLGSTAPDADVNDMFSVDALGDDITPLGNPTLNEEDAWPVEYKQIADKNYNGKITATIPYKKALKDDIIVGWIDFNVNGKFDPNERVTVIIPADGDGNVTLEWTVPATRVAYSTYVRLRYFGRNQDATSPTGNALNGEVEDHRIYILTPAVSNPMLINKSK